MPQALSNDIHQRLLYVLGEEPKGEQNLESHPFIVCYSYTARRHGEDVLISRYIHAGMSTLESALKSVKYFRDLASKGEPFLGTQNIRAAWVEYTFRTVLEV